MKTIGMVGGLGPESTVDYYRLLLEQAREAGASEAPHILIDSLDVAQMIALVNAGRLDEMTRKLVESVAALARAGAELAFFSANTPHLVFDAVERTSPVPLVSIVDAACEVAAARGLERLGLLGTRFTMEARFYPERFAARGITIVTPAGVDRDFVHEKYVGELIPGNFRDTTREGFVAIMDRLRADQGIDGVILGGTELPLLLRGVEYPLPLLDTTHIHVAAVLARAAG